MSDNWIKCSERLPDNNVMVLIYDTKFAKSDASDERFETATKRPHGVRFGKYIASLNQMRPEGCNGSEYSVTHWQPLPPPPKP